MSENRNSIKIFVGNVPFQCTKDEFVKCFSSMDSYVTADIIRRPKSKLSRGFGFVELNNTDKASELLQNNSVFLKDRTLRFTPYTNQYREKNRNVKTDEKQTTSSIEQEIKSIYNNMNSSGNYMSTDSIQYKVFITNIPEEITLDELKNMLSHFGIVTSCYINNKRVVNGKISGNATFQDNESYKKALDTKTIPDSNIDMVPYRKPVKRFNRLNDARTTYREGFRAGHLVGYQQGLSENKN